MSGINIHINNTPFTFQSRDKKILESLKKYKVFDKIYYLGIWESPLKKSEKIDSVRTIIRFKTRLITTPSNNFFKMIKLFEWFIKILIYLRKKPADCVNCHSLPLLPFCVLLKIIKKSKLVYDTHELETETHVTRGLRKFFSKIIEWYFIRFVDEVIVVSHSMANWYKKKYSLEKVWVVRNIPHALKSTQVKSNLLRRKFNIQSDEKLFLYQGVIADGRGIVTLLRVFSKIKKDNHIVFMGFGELCDEVKKYSLKNDNIHYHQAVKPDELQKYSSSADVGVNLLENSCLNHFYCLPNKIWEYLNGMVPILVCDYPEMKKVVDQFQCGWTISPDEINIQKKIEKISFTEINKKKKNVIKMRGKFGWHEEEKTLYKIYQNLGFIN